MRRNPKILVFVSLALAAAVGFLAGHVEAKGGGERGAPARRAARKASSHDEYFRLIFHAVLEGLYEDGVANEQVDVILRKDPATGSPMHFVPACPLCDPALLAFRVYRERPPFPTKVPRDTFGPGLEPDLVESLASDGMKARLDAVNQLVERYVRRRFELMRLTPEESSRWSAGMAERRKKGMASLRGLQAAGTAGAYDGFKGCAVCDAANGACEAR